MTVTARIFLRGIPAEELIWTLERQTPGMRGGRYKGIQFVAGESYQFAILLNEGMTVTAPPERTACFLMEPPDKFRPQPHPSIGRLFSFNPADRAVFGERFVHHHMVSFLHAAILPDRNPLPSAKPRFMSMVVSGKTQLPFQEKRWRIAQRLLATDLAIDFYGRDLVADPKDPRIKGPLPRIDKTAALRDYAYSLAFENSAQDGYLTEKFMDCLANHCVPITNNPTALSRFPTGSFRYLDFAQPVDRIVGQIADLVTAHSAPDDRALFAAKDLLLHGPWSLAEAIADFIGSASGSVPSPASAPIINNVAATPPPAPVKSVASPGSQTPAKTPLISVLFLSCRRMHYLRRTVAAIRQHFAEVESDIPARFLCFDNGSSAEDRQELAELGFDLLLLSQANLGIGPAMNHLVSTVRTPFILNLQDDWVVTNPSRVRFIHEALLVMQADPKMAHIKLDNYHFLDFSNRSTYDGPFQAPGGTVPFYCQNPRMMWGGFSFPPALTRVAALHELGPFREDKPFQRGWAESEYTQRYVSRFVAAKSPEMAIFTHIGIESTTGWGPQDRERPNAGSASPGVTAPGMGRPPTSIAFIIPYRRDSAEREANLGLVSDHLRRCAESWSWQADILIQSPDGELRKGEFSKAKLLNGAARRSHADIFALIDADVLVPEPQLKGAIDRLLDGADFSYPYREQFLNVPRSLISRIGAERRIDFLFHERLENLNPGSFGGAVLFRRSVFWAGGGLNEHFVSWGREDVELHDRFAKLGYRCHREDGPLFHLDHPRTADSSRNNPHYHANVAEHARITALDRHQLIDEIAAWSWCDG